MNIHLVNDCSIHGCQHNWISGDCLHRWIGDWFLTVILQFYNWFNNSFPWVFERVSIIYIEVLQLKILFNLLWYVFYQVILQLLSKYLSCRTLLFIDFIAKYINVFAFAFSKWFLRKHLQIFRVIFFLTGTNFDDFNRHWQMSCPQFLIESILKIIYDSSH